jgi:hypothetical protein
LAKAGEIQSDAAIKAAPAQAALSLFFVLIMYYYPISLGRICRLNWALKWNDCGQSVEIVPIRVNC